MLAGTGLVVCSACGKVVHEAPGHCELCGEQLSEKELVLEAA